MHRTIRPLGRNRVKFRHDPTVQVTATESAVKRRLVAPLLILALAGAACHADIGSTTDPDGVAEVEGDSVAIISDEVRDLAFRNGYQARRTRNRATPELVALGRVLLFDRELSGPREVSCMTCHLPHVATADGKSLSVGVGGAGLGPTRSHPDNIFIPRNAPSLLNLDEVANTMFWDGRIRLRNGQLETPAGDQITPEMRAVFQFGAMSAQPMFPVLSREEMRGTSGNELADIPDEDMTAIWAALMTRLGAIDEYRTLFEAAYPGTAFDNMTFAHASNAIAGFFISELSFNDSGWDRFMRGNNRAVRIRALRGARSFFREGCVSCHRGSAFTDQRFHNVAMAQIGPGQGDGPSLLDDFGRGRVTGNAEELWAFRTAPLRNLELTGPYGHAGQFVELEDFVDHYSDSEAKLRNYDPTQLEPALQGTFLDNIDAILSTRDRRLENIQFSRETVERITAFLLTLTDEQARDLSGIVPARVPSGLPIDGN